VRRLEHIDAASLDEVKAACGSWMVRALAIANVTSVDDGSLAARSFHDGQFVVFLFGLRDADFELMVRVPMAAIKREPLGTMH
jgi:hypothetical protein